MRAYGKIYIQIAVMFILLESALKVSLKNSVCKYVHSFSRLHAYLQVSCRFEFTNLQCKSLNDSLVKVDACLIKSVNRTYKHASVKLSLLKSATHIMVCCETLRLVTKPV